MRFESNEERMKHPQARLIPDLLWNDGKIFNEQLDDELLTLMNTRDEELIDKLHELFPEISEKGQADDKQIIWLVIALSHPHLSHSVLLGISAELKLRPENLYQYAAVWGDLSFFEYLTQMYLHRGELERVIVAHSYAVFSNAVLFKHEPIMKLLLNKAPDKMKLMLSSAVVRAFKFGDIDVIKLLMAQAPDEVQNMIKANDYAVFRDAVLWQRRPIVELFMANKAPDEVQNMIKAKDYEAFIQAAEGNRLDVLELLMDKMSGEVHNEIKAHNYQAVYLASRRGNKKIIELFMAKAPDEVLNIIRAHGYGVFLEAVKFNQLDVMELFIAKMPAEEVQRMASARNYEAFRCATATSRKFFPIVNRLLLIPELFNYADMHSYEFGEEFVAPFVVTTLAELRAQKARFEVDNPNAVFHVADPEKAKLYFYFIRNLIRCNGPDMGDDILFLLEIPEVKALAHTEVSAHRPNELLLFALNIHNQRAVDILLLLPEVRRLAMENNYYVQYGRDGIRERDLAGDQESSMQALTRGEQHRLTAALNCYEPKIKKEGVFAVITNLKAELARRYLASAPTILVQVNGKDTLQKLPLHWEEFIALDLKGLQKENALQLYYQNKDHSAFRYLSKPNHWMHENAAYVESNPANPTEKWSTFEEYQPFIAMLYLAAIDKEELPIDGHTLESRLAHFIDELAHIDRAHNWDKSRRRMNKKGITINEDYDDLEGDRPSCYSGVKRRLFQSVLGHSLFKKLTIERVDAELYQFLRTHFQTAIHDDNCATIKGAWDNLINGTWSDADLFIFKTLDLTKKQEDEFIQSLAIKYGSQFTDDPTFTNHIQKTFKLTPQDAHALTLNYVHWEQFLVIKEDREEIQKRAILKNQFLALLSQLRNKHEGYLKTIPGAHKEAEVLIKRLEQASDHYFSSRATQETVQQFKEACGIALNPDNYSELQQHRNVLGAFFAAIKHFFVACKKMLWSEPRN